MLFRSEGLVVDVERRVQHSALSAEGPGEPALRPPAVGEDEVVALTRRLQPARPAERLGLAEDIDLARLHTHALERDLTVGTALPVEPLNETEAGIDADGGPEREGVIEQPAAHLFDRSAGEASAHRAGGRSITVRPRAGAQ